MLDTSLIPILEYDANTTCILDSHIYRERTADRIYPALHSKAGNHVLAVIMI
jgi:hypothetical protein